MSLGNDRQLMKTMQVDEFRYNPQSEPRFSDLFDETVGFGASGANRKGGDVDSDSLGSIRSGFLRRAIAKIGSGIKAMIIRIPKRNTFVTLMTLLVIYAVA